MVNNDNYKIEAESHSTSQVIGEKTVAGYDAEPSTEYDEGYEFNRFFKAHAGFMVNPPKYLTDSLYIGEEGGSRSHVTLHSATLCKLDVFQKNYAVLNDQVDKVNEILKNKMQPNINMN